MLHDFAAQARVLLLVAALVLGLLAAACTGPPTPTRVPPTPTPLPDPVSILLDAAANLRSLQSTEFVVKHEAGAIFIPAFSAKLTEARGVWDVENGAELEVDAYLVANVQTEAESGIYFGLQSVITPDAYYGTDPFSGAWLKQPQSLAPIPVSELNHLMADVVDMIVDPVLDGEEEVDGASAYKISGGAPASALDWLPLTAEEGQRVHIELWTDTVERQLRRMRLTGPVGMFDQPDTVREILLTNINGTVAIEPPSEFTDLTGG